MNVGQEINVKDKLIKPKQQPRFQNYVEQNHLAGDAKIINGNRRIVHLINITNIEETVPNFRNSVNRLDMDLENKILLLQRVDGVLQMTSRLKLTRPTSTTLPKLIMSLKI